MKQAVWAAQVSNKLKKAGIMLPLEDRPESIANNVVRLEDPFSICRALSTEDVAWISAFSTDYSESRFFSNAYCSTVGLDSRLFKKAVSFASMGEGRFDPSYGRLVAVNYDLLSKTSKVDLSRIHFHIMENALGGTLKERIDLYSMKWLSTKNNNFSGYPEGISEYTDPERLELYMDAPLGFALSYNKIENAISTFWAENADTVMIHQLQGVRKKKFRGPLKLGRHHSVGLNMVDFRKAIVEYVSEIAKESGFSLIAIKGAINNSWTSTDDEGNSHIPIERAFQVYDETAKRLGFIYRKNGNWYKDIGP